MTPLARENVTQLVTAILAVHGGLNDRSKRALLEIARLHGYSAEEILRILEQVARHDHDATILAITHAADAPDPGEDRADRERKDQFAKLNHAARVTLAILTVSLFSASAILLVLSALALRGIRPLEPSTDARIVTPSREPIAAVVDGSRRESPAPPRGRAAPPFDPASYDALLQPFDEAPDRFRDIGAEAFTPVSEAIDNLSQAWTTLDRTTIEAAANRIANLLLVLEKDRTNDHAERLLDLVLVPSAHLASGDRSPGRFLAPARVPPAVWSVGVAARLQKETFTDPSIRTRIETHLSRIFLSGEGPAQPSFRAGATAATTLLARTAIDAASVPFATADESVWSEIRRALVTLYDLKEQPTRDAVIGLIGYALRTAPPPSRSSVANAAFATLIPLVDWSERESGQALLTLFDDDTVPTESLAAVLRAVQEEPSAPDMSWFQPLTPAAPPIQRANIRDQIAEAYTLPQSPTDGWVEHKWTPAAILAVAPSADPASADPTDPLARAATFARLSAAAALRWNGSFDEAERELETAFNAVNEARSLNLGSTTGETKLDALTSPASVTDGRFALAYTNAKRNADRRTEAIQSLIAATGPIGPADADVLAQAAFYAVPIEVRSAAQRACQLHVQSVAMTHALLESLPDAPRIDVTNEFLERFLGTALPDPSERDWLLETRRAVLAKLHGLIAAQRRPLIDRLAEDLTRTTSLKLRGGAPVGPTETARELFDQSLRTARQYRATILEQHAPERVELRHGRRTAIARGSIQLYLAHRLSAVELFAYTVVAERPSNERRALEILRELDAARADATHVFQQIEATERAALKLWAIRLATDLAPHEEAYGA